MTLGDPALVIPRSVREAGARAFRREPATYTPNLGLTALRKLIAEDLNSRLRLHTQYEQVCVTNGGNQAISLAMALTTAAGDAVLLPTPGYPNFGLAAHFTGNRIRTYRCDAATNWAPTVERLEESYTPDVRLVVLNAPSNPTGSTIGGPDLVSIAAWAAKRNVWILSDECYWPYSLASLDSVAQYAPARTLVLESFSKRFGFTGWRVGSLTVPGALVENLEKGQEATVACINSPAQFAAMEALNQQSELYPAQYRRIDAQRRELVTALKRAGLTDSVGDAGIYAWANFEEVEFLSGSQWSVDLANLHRVAVTPGAAFGQSDGRWARLSAAVSEPHFRVAITRIGLM